MLGQRTAATASLIGSAARLRLPICLAALARTVWGIAAGVLFLLAFPLAVVLAPLIWAIGKLRGKPGSD
jgi:hypothetical protein